MNAQVPDSAMDPEEIRVLPKLAAEYMGKSLLDLVVQEMRVMPDIWQKMSQAKQQETLERARNRIKYAVAGAVNTIATHGHTALTATVESIALKDKIKLTVLIDKGNVTESLHTLYESGSESRCQILLTSAEPYVGDMELIEAEPDQPGFDLKMPTADEDMPWAISCPIDRGQTTNIVPAPNKILAMQYSELIRNKLLESDSDFRHDLAKSVYACPWRESVGAHERSMQAGNWETLVSWASNLSTSTDDDYFDASPLLAIGYVHADADVPAPETPVVESEIVDGEFVEPEAVAATEYSEEELNDPEFLTWFEQAKVIAEESNNEAFKAITGLGYFRALFDEGLNPEHAVLRIDSGLPF